jgi:hypothetical protein
VRRYSQWDTSELTTACGCTPGLSWSDQASYSKFTTGVAS